MARPRVDFALGGLVRAAQKMSSTADRATQVVNRAKSTLQRRLRAETARVISRDALNLSARKASTGLIVESKTISGGSYITVSAQRTRLPLSDYTPRFSRLDGVTVTTWRAKPPQHLPHAFRRKDKAGVWQRIPQGRGGQLVARLPIVERKGPSMHRVFETGGRYAGHTDIRPQLSTFVQTTLTQEIARLIRSGR